MQLDGEDRNNSDRDLSSHTRSGVSSNADALTRSDVEQQHHLTSVSLKPLRSGMVSFRTTLRVLALTKFCNQPYNLPRLVNSFLPDSIRVNCENYSTMLTSDPITAPFGTWKSPLESETVYQKSASISDLLVDVKTGKVFHVEVSPQF